MKSLDELNDKAIKLLQNMLKTTAEPEDRRFAIQQIMMYTQSKPNSVPEKKDDSGKQYEDELKKLMKEMGIDGT